jgi:hypothetical protein
LEFQVDAIKDVQIEELKKFHKSYFNLDTITETASELMYLGEMRAVIQREINDPSDELTRYLTRLVYNGSVTQKVLDRFRGFVKHTFAQYINDVLNERLSLAIKQQDSVAEAATTAPTESTPDVTGNDKPKLETTQEELEGYVIVKSLIHDLVDVKRIAYRDQQTYFTVLLDDNNRKPICRLWYNSTKKYVGTFDASKVETKHEITSNDELFKVKDLLRATVSTYESQSSTVGNTATA